MKRPENISVPDWKILQEKYKNNLEEKLNSGLPVQYLIGNVTFLDFLIEVDSRVLIPRFETETLVEKTIKYINEMFNDKVNIIDLGTGSGCIAIALKKNINCNMNALDVSEDALAVAKKNALNNNVEINFIKGDMIYPLKDNYDIIISNPPYIPKDGYVEKIVKDNEPNLALYANDNGLYFYKEILKRHLKNLNKPGIIAFEIGDNQKQDLIEILKYYPNLKYKFECDLQGLPRYLFIFNE